MIGIIGNMEIEVEGLKEVLENKKEKIINKMKYVQGTYCGKDCVVSCCSPGKVNAAICAQTMIFSYNPKYIINIGVAGAMDKDIKLADIVIAKDVIQHDIDTTLVGDPKGMISGINKINIECSQKLNSTILEISKEITEYNIKFGTILTGDQFIGEKEKLLKLKEEFNGMACEMEGGSIGQTCYMNNKEFTVIRSISDNANDDASMDYNKFKVIAAKRSIDLVCKLIERI